MSKLSCITSDKRVKLVTIPGSSKVGAIIAMEAASHFTKYVSELGGKNPLDVLDDADLDYAVNTATFSNFFHQGQVCMTASRVITEKGAVMPWKR